MNDAEDPLLEFRSPDRVHYATGQLLGAKDFSLEQTYHRSQLARALMFLHGSGTIAGLKVTAIFQPGAQPEVELEVHPGLALDGAGRLVDVPVKCCLRLRRWYEFIAARKASSEEDDLTDLVQAWHAEPPGPDTGAVLVDVFLAFHPCNGGFTPAFASGPFDALDAYQPSRVRDAFELSLVLRKETEDANTGDGLKKLTAAENDFWKGVTIADLNDRIFAAWERLQIPRMDAPDGSLLHPDGVDPTAIQLARLHLPAPRPANALTAPEPDWGAGAWPAANPTANIDNGVRQFVVPPAALRRLAGF
jgi:hypothetical protein